LKSDFCGFGHKGVGICGLGDVLGNIDIDYAEPVVDCPIDVRRQTVVLFGLDLLVEGNCWKETYYEGVVGVDLVVMRIWLS
jgi:hypothetical protein